MTASDWRKALKQFNNKLVIRAKYIKHNKPKERKFGVAAKKCERCGRFGAHLGQYNLNLCRQCFRDLALELGFNKYS